MRLFRRATASEAEIEAGLVWLFASPRSGTTWLQGLLVAHPQVVGIDEPLIGLHLGIPAWTATGAGVDPGERGAERILDTSKGRRDYFFSERYRDVWRPDLRSMVLHRLGAGMVDRQWQARRGRCVVKEPHGSEVADLLSDLLPGSRLLWLVRDGRDVVDSSLDAIRPGSWGSSTAVLDVSDDAARRRAITDFAQQWVQRTTVTRNAFTHHAPERKLLVRYEDLLADTSAVLADITRWMGVPPFEDVADVVARRAFESLPEDKRGAGMFTRAAQPGLWREHFSPDEVALLAEVMGDDLRVLGYDV